MSLKSAICRVLIVLMAWTPFQIAQAGMIGTQQVVSQQQASADRAAVVAFLARSDVAGQMQSLGVDQKAAQDRVNAMTDEEVGQLASQINTLPAGATSGWGTLLIILIIVGVVWWAMK